MFILGLGTAVPAARYGQLECWEALCASPRFPAISAPARALLQRVLCGDSGVRTRHLALDSVEEAFEIDPDILAVLREEVDSRTQAMMARFASGRSEIRESDPDLGVAPAIKRGPGRPRKSEEAEADFSEL